MTEGHPETDGLCFGGVELSPRCGFCLEQEWQHEAGAGSHREVGAVAGGFEEGEGFVAEAGLGGGEIGEGFEGHGADGDAAFFETGADEREQAHALGRGRCVESGGHQYISAGLPFFFRKLGGYFSEQVGVSGQQAGLAAADEAGDLGGAAMLIRVSGTEGADQVSRGPNAMAREELTRGIGGIGGFPGAGAVGSFRRTGAGEDGPGGAPLARSDFGVGHGPSDRGQYTASEGNPDLQ